MKLRFRAVAEREFFAAIDWYEAHSEGLGSRFQTAVDEAISRIVATSDSFPQVDHGVYELRVSRFPYCIYYRVRRDVIMILAVFHHARDPETRKKRR